MIKTLLVFFLLLANLEAKDDIDKKINNASGQIKHTSKSYSSVHKKMARNAKIRQQQLFKYEYFTLFGNLLKF